MKRRFFRMISTVMTFAMTVSMAFVTMDGIHVHADMTACGQNHDTNLYQKRVISQTGTSHTYRYFCPECNMLLDGTQTYNLGFDTKTTEHHSDYPNATITITNSSYHTYSGTCDVCGAYSIGEDHKFDDKGICTVCKYDKNNPNGNESSSGSGGAEGAGGNSGAGGGNSGAAGGNSGAAGGNSGSGGQNDDGGAGGGDGATSQNGRKIASIPQVNNPVYNGKTQTGVASGTGYTITGNKGTNAGSYKATAKLKNGYTWPDGSKKNKSFKWKIKKAPNPIAIKTHKNYKVKYSKIKKSSLVVPYGKLFRASKAIGKKRYFIVKGSNVASVDKSTGKVTIKKGVKKGTYDITVKVTAQGDRNHEKGVVTGTFRITVK
ncbi:hypothetical protein [Butyrivibrio sp. AD3002]|uniref:hypothetical protein n=1 Tax=Butyrivibrio sp. AD3002 TaxID=1280670 RepID=UPI0012DFDA8A|nr:hypothetical protein [Butyrivibrio sp. AD3002]